MPKRAATPPLDDEAKYLTVINPFPLRPNMEFDNHRKLCAQWVVAIIGAAYFRAFYYKPSSPGVVILELDETMPNFDIILGGHKWADFLVAPGETGKEISKIFYCTYQSDRAVQKNGWKRIDVKDAWVKKPSSKFRTPYPETFWCDIPRQGVDVIQNDLCRPLPRASFPPPPPTEERVPVVGTPEWQAWKQKQAASSKVKTWVREAPRVGGTNPPSTASYSASVSRAPSGQATPATTSRSSSSNISPISPSDENLNAPVLIAGNDVVRSLASLKLDEDHEDEYFTVADAASALDDTEGYLLDEPRVEYGHGKPVFEVVDSLWGDSVSTISDDEEEEDDAKALAKAAQKNPGNLCSIHNRVCAKGICKEYAEQLRKELLDKRRKEREEQKSKRNKKEKNNSKASTTSGQTSPSPAPVQRARPPHLGPGAAPLPSPGAAGMPGHLRKRGAPPLTPSPISPQSHSPSPRGRTTPTPSRRPDDDDDDDDDGEDARSKSSGWGSLSEDLYGPGRARKAAAPSAPAPAAQSAAPKTWGAWGGAPSVSASSARRNNASWSVSTHDVADLREFEGDGDGGEDAYDTYDAGSVSGRSATGWGTAHAGAGTSASASASADGPWGSTDAVRAAAAARRGASRGGSGRAQSQGGKTKKTWAEQMDDEFDTKSVVSTVSKASTWGNISAGPW